MAKVCREGKGWSIRAQYKGQEIYKSGFASARKAEEYLREQQCLLDQGGKPARQGPEQTALCVACPIMPASIGGSFGYRFWLPCQ